ncbi:hypothetical protein IFM89_033491 [Coptis chinensis]|uniref:Ribosomal protein L2 C-terminal domain-containing protein n=1 Tax=Coptis chinensis TaxID=261450 RepID=A0A835LXZ0_9MAGN|nr:hypothetical protein IFM89_033491 [Coptis chinensis]
MQLSTVKLNSNAPLFSTPQKRSSFSNSIFLKCYNRKECVVVAAASRMPINCFGAAAADERFVSRTCRIVESSMRCVGLSMGAMKVRVKRNCWPKVCGVAMNPVEHPHGGGSVDSRIKVAAIGPLKRRLRYYAFVLNFFFGSDLCQTFVIHILRKKGCWYSRTKVLAAFKSIFLACLGMWSFVEEGSRSYGVMGILSLVGLVVFGLEYDLDIFNIVDVPDYDLTFAVLTKLDLMDKGTNAVDVLEGRAYRLQHPWVGVVNRSQADINRNVDMIAARRREREYFASSPDNRHLASKMGPEYLAKLLSKTEEVIRARIPNITSLINKTIDELESEMDHLGRPIALDAGAHLYTILELCRAFDQIQGTSRWRKEDEFIFPNIFERPIPSILRDYSAPICLDYDLTQSDLLFLLMHDWMNLIGDGKTAFFSIKHGCYLSECLLGLAFCVRVPLWRDEDLLWLSSLSSQEKLNQNLDLGFARRD